MIRINLLPNEERKHRRASVSIKTGDLVMIEETRPISKTKAWKVTKLVEKAKNI